MNVTEDELYARLQPWLIKHKFIEPLKRQYTIGLFQSFLKDVMQHEKEEEKNQVA